MGALHCKASSHVPDFVRELDHDVEPFVQASVDEVHELQNVVICRHVRHVDPNTQAGCIGQVHDGFPWPSVTQDLGAPEEGVVAVGSARKAVAVPRDILAIGAGRALWCNGDTPSVGRP